jgi:hypothetical protein
LPLTAYVDAEGNELYDVPDGQLADPEAPAPVRFLPEYDNVVLSHADRSRVIPDGRQVPLPPGNGAAMGTVLVDGMFQGTWRVRRSADRTVVQVEPFRTLTPAEREDVTGEGQRLLEFVAPGDTAYEVQVGLPG